MALVLKTTRSTPLTSKNVIYSDFFSNMNLTPVRNDLATYENEDSVKRALKNLILTDKGERFFNPIFGCDVRRLLFENLSEVTDQVMKDLIKTAVSNFEPRAEIIDVVVSSNPDNNSVYVSIVFSVINKSEPITLELILNRIR